MSRDTITVNIRDGHLAGKTIVLPAGRSYFYYMPPFDVSSMQDESYRQPPPDVRYDIRLAAIMQDESYRQPPPDVRYDIRLAAIEVETMDRAYICQQDPFTEYDVHDYDWLSYMGRASLLRIRLRAYIYFGFSGPLAGKLQLQTTDVVDHTEIICTDLDNRCTTEPIPQGWGLMDGSITFEQAHHALSVYLKQRLPTYALCPSPVYPSGLIQVR